MVKEQPLTLLEQSYEGGWKDGGMWNGTLYDTNGKILHKIVNGEIRSP